MVSAACSGSRFKPRGLAPTIKLELSFALNLSTANIMVTGPFAYISEIGGKILQTGVHFGVTQPPHIPFALRGGVGCISIGIKNGYPVVNGNRGIADGKNGIHQIGN